MPDKLFESLALDGDAEWLFIDRSIVKAHQDSCDAASHDEQAISKSRGGNSTKIHFAVDSGGLPLYFELSDGPVNNIAHAESLINHTPSTTSVIAEKGYDSQPLRETIEVHSRTANIPRRNKSKVGNADIDWCLYRYRHLVENVFMKIKRTVRNHSIRQIS